MREGPPPPSFTSDVIPFRRPRPLSDLSRPLSGVPRPRDRQSELNVLVVHVHTKFLAPANETPSLPCIGVATGPVGSVVGPGALREPCTRLRGRKRPGHEGAPGPNTSGRGWPATLRSVVVLGDGGPGWSGRIHLSGACPAGRLDGSTGSRSPGDPDPGSGLGLSKPLECPEEGGVLGKSLGRSLRCCTLRPRPENVPFLRGSSCK